MLIDKYQLVVLLDDYIGLERLTHYLVVGDGATFNILNRFFNSLDRHILRKYRHSLAFFGFFRQNAADFRLRLRFILRRLGAERHLHRLDGSCRAHGRAQGGHRRRRRGGLGLHRLRRGISALAERLGAHALIEIRLRADGLLRRFRELYFRRLPFSRERGQHRVVYRVKDLALFGELDLCLGRMDIDVHAAVAQLYIQRAGGIAASEQRIFIRLLHGGLQKLRFYKSAVAEEELRTAVALAVGGRGDEASHVYAVVFARAAEHLRRHVAPHKGVDAGLLFPVAGGEEFFVSVLYKAYRHFRMPKRAAQRRKLAGGCLAAVALQEFQPRGGVIEQVAHGHRRPVRAACGEHLLNVPGLEHDAGAARVAATAGVEFYF